MYLLTLDTLSPDIICFGYFEPYLKIPESCFDEFVPRLTANSLSATLISVIPTSTFTPSFPTFRL